MVCGGSDREFDAWPTDGDDNWREIRQSHAACCMLHARRLVFEDYSVAVPTGMHDRPHKDFMKYRQLI